MNAGLSGSDTTRAAESIIEVDASNGFTVADSVQVQFDGLYFSADGAGAAFLDAEGAKGSSITIVNSVFDGAMAGVADELGTFYFMYNSVTATTAADGPFLDLTGDASGDPLSIIVTGNVVDIAGGAFALDHVDGSVTGNLIGADTAIALAGELGGIDLSANTLAAATEGEGVGIRLDAVEFGAPVTIQGGSFEDFLAGIVVANAPDTPSDFDVSDLSFTAVGTALVNDGVGLVAMDSVTVSGTAIDVLAVSGSDAHSVAGGAGADWLLGQGGADTIAGDGGSDTVDGGDGADDLQAGDGFDRFRAAPDPIC